MPQFDNSMVLTQLADALPFGVYVTDVHRKIQFWNRAAEGITGHLRQEVIGRACCEDIGVHCTSSGGVVCATDRCPLETVLRGGDESTTGLLVRHKTGNLVPVLIRSLPLRNEHGTIVAVAEIFQAESAGPSEQQWIEPSSLHPALGIPTFAASKEHLRSLLTRTDATVGLFLVELANAHELEQRCGSLMVRTARTTILQTLATATRFQRHIGCWSHERFLVQVPDCSADTLASTQAAIAELRGGCEVTWWGDHIPLTLKVTEILARPGDCMDSVVKQLEMLSAETPDAEAGARP